MLQEQPWCLSQERAHPPQASSVTAIKANMPGVPEQHMDTEADTTKFYLISAS